MKAASKIKDEARKHEQREEWDRAIQLYLQVLRVEDDGIESDLPLYNRIGDLHVRLGKPADAVKYYEQAADRYAEAGLFNNAIALCNKALRYQPARLPLFRKLGQFCAQQGFLTDARRWYLEFADRMFKHGDLDEAFSALDDFANISDDPDVRTHLGRRLHAHDRQDEALDEFRRAYDSLIRTDQAEAAETLRKEVLQLFPGGPDLALEDRGAWSPGRRADEGPDSLPTFGDAPPAAKAAPAEAPVSAAAAGESDAAPEPAALEGMVPTQLSDAATLEESGTGQLAGLDTGRDDTFDRMRAEESTEPALPLIDDSPGAAPDEVEEEAEAAPGLPLLGEEPEPAEPPPPPEPPPAAFAVGAMDLRPDEPAAAAPTPAAAPARTAAPASDDYVDLYALLAPEEDRVETTRFFIQESEPTGDEDHDFAELLNQFRAKLAEHVPENDAGSHYDLGLAFKEMGLYDDAISEFQIALRAGQDRLKVFEELGQCFIEKAQFNIAVKVLSRALQFEHHDELELIGVYYFLGRAYEELGQAPAARDAYERVLGLDLRFEDVQQRVARL